MENGSKEKRINRKKLVAFILVIICFIGIWFYSYRSQTGLWPIIGLNSPEIILPPELHPTEQTYDQVMGFLKSDDTDQIEYSEGFNCVDASFRLWRNAMWEGIASILVRVNYENSDTHHMIVAFPTADRGDIVVEPQEDILVRPRIGNTFNGQVVNGLYVLNMLWIPIDGSPELESGYEIE